MSEEPKVGIGEFTRSLAGFAQQLEDVAETARATLAEARKTNGRVTALESKLAEFERAGFVSRRDIVLVGGTLAATVAVIKWLPVLLAAAKVAP